MKQRRSIAHDSSPLLLNYLQIGSTWLRLYSVTLQICRRLNGFDGTQMLAVIVHWPCLLTDCTGNIKVSFTKQSSSVVLTSPVKPLSHTLKVAQISPPKSRRGSVQQEQQSPPPFWGQPDYRGGEKSEEGDLPATLCDPAAD